ncbi:hemerythrin domain-containing protein [Janthinobacterium sp. 17J80-10]|uniref:hemerythrin domain-containing protein n=1 Tax=Janthinobacterium sp. 17J80-10 TaxID=2497863 RepID=UPI00100567E5|nr:hemerythrin domain-containing protein [Janthinobacterium sp. 17J80-10]QAU35352.1 hemerythrin domain-containing protein [Janthinobacterium sp. 17J80-10]
MNTVTDYMSTDHKHCDDVFAALENSVRSGQWDLAAETFKEFTEAMDVHFSMEEDVLFPAFEQATGSRAGPTAVMRDEHQELRGMLGQLGDALRLRDAIEFSGVADTLNIMLQQHNMKEEGILYPMADRMLAASRDVLLTEMSNLKVPA